MKAILTCSVCYQAKTVDAGQTIDGLDLETWWMTVRRQTCAECFAHTCWAPVAGTVCFYDKGHPGGHFPWRPEYGDTPEGAEPLVGLWLD